MEYPIFWSRIRRRRCEISDIKGIHQKKTRLKGVREIVDDDVELTAMKVFEELLEDVEIER